MALADVVHEAQQPCAAVYCPQQFQQLDMQLDVLAATCRDKLRTQVIKKS